ncbi:hypothetical protein, partial [Agathobaculum desmolans]|uniref:hypothetical protein n=1 Tax=Agathobaculum desmolans TaxID=39484 RepID=UPI002942B8D5
MHQKISTLKRFTAFLLTLCCIFSMFPAMTPSASAAPPPAEDVQYRYVWLISQPGIQVRFRNDDPENPPEVAMMEENTSSAKWFPMKEIPDPNNPGKQIWVVDPDSYEYTTKYKVPQPGMMGADRNDIGLLRVSTHFNQTTKPRPDAWPNAEFEYDDPYSKSFNSNEINESNHDTTWWAGNITGGTVCKTYPDMDDWRECIDPMPFDSKQYFPSSFWTQEVSDFAPSGDTFYYIQFQLRSEDLPKLAEILETTGDTQFEYGNNSMFRFVSKEKLGMPNFDNQGTVIFDFNLPGHE